MKLLLIKSNVSCISLKKSQYVHTKALTVHIHRKSVYFYVCVTKPLDWHCYYHKVIVFTLV